MSQSDKQSTERAKKAHRGGERRSEEARTGSDGIPVLRWSPQSTNYPKFVKGWIANGLRLYGRVADFFETDEWYVPRKPKWEDFAPEASTVELGDEVADDQLTVHDEVAEIERKVALAAYQNAVKERVKKMDDLEERKGMIYGHMLTKMSMESLDRVKSDAKWDRVNKDRDPLLLWRLIRETHKVGAETSTKQEHVEAEDPHGVLRYEARPA